MRWINTFSLCFLAQVFDAVEKCSIHLNAPIAMHAYPCASPAPALSPLKAKNEYGEKISIYALP